MLNRRLLVLCGIVVFLAGCHKQAHKASVKHEIPQLSAFFDARPSETPVSYLYSPGFQATEVAMGRLCPSFIAVTGEKVAWRSGVHVIDEPHSAVVYPEIDLRKPTYFTMNPITAIVNGLRRDLFPLAQRCIQDMLDMTVEDNPDSALSVANYGFNFSKANLAQKADIAALRKTYTEHIKKYPQTDVILYGDSRGAATIFNFIALHKPAYVKAAVLEGIFDDVPHAVKHFLYTDKTAAEEKRLYGLAKFMLGSYKENGDSPRKCAKIIGDDIPLLIVISLKDGLVPPQSAFYLYNCLRQRGHQQVHMLVLKKSRHPAYVLQDEEDKNVYESTVHAFYKRYNLPYNSALAAQGQKSFDLTQPTAEFLEKTYQLPRCALCYAIQN